MGLAQLRQPSRLVADHSALLPVLQLYPLAMSFVYGIDPDSHLLGGWQFDPNKLKTQNILSMEPVSNPSCLVWQLGRGRPPGLSLVNQNNPYLTEREVRAT